MPDAHHRALNFISCHISITVLIELREQNLDLSSHFLDDSWVQLLHTLKLLNLCSLYKHAELMNTKLISVSNIDGREDIRVITHIDAWDVHYSGHDSHELLSIDETILVHIKLLMKRVNGNFFSLEVLTNALNRLTNSWIETLESVSRHLWSYVPVIVIHALTKVISQLVQANPLSISFGV